MDLLHLILSDDEEERTKVWMPSHMPGHREDQDKEEKQRFWEWEGKLGKRGRRKGGKPRGHPQKTQTFQGNDIQA